MRKMKGKKLLALLLAVLMMATVFVFAGCQSNQKEDTQDEQQQTEETADVQEDAAADTSLDDVMAKGELILGLDDSFPPMGFRNDENEIVGFDIDLAKAVADKLGVTLAVQPISWDAKEMELNSGNIDMIWNGMSYNEERDEAMNLSEPYLNNDMVFVVANGSEIADLEGLKGKTVAVQNGSTAQDILEASDLAADITVVGFKDNMTALLDMEAQGCDAVFMDKVVANYTISANGKDYQVLEEGLSPEVYVIGFRKGDQALRDAVQQALHELKEDGTVAEISTKWFGSDVTIIE
ncbi:MAG: amino acid ABC transporter substrate-binding protein [Clostridia bacterium]|jgi:polar amino acid transport system substrate-binding protein|nr:amino acid ABC transporter substrate-binding protein [Clostridia bacterium]MBQ4249106.1 amino acid ABC transporter substrate-binding protein [Clostridia bacterium]